MKSAKSWVLFASFFCVFTFYINVHAVPGDLDTTFDTDGKVTTSIKFNDYAQDVAVQSDGKIVVCGYSDDGMTPINSDLSLTRYNSDGSLDQSFGTGGKLLITEADNQNGFALKIQPDGKILVSGKHANHLAVYRLNANGTLDTSFGTNGRVNHIIEQESFATDIAVQSDGKLVLSGIVRISNIASFAVIKLNADGSLDTTFNLNGYKIILNSFGIGAYVVALQNDGKIIVGGRDLSNDTGYWGRFDSAGSLEGGNLLQTSVQINSIAIQPDGKIVFAGSSRNFGSGSTNFAITRYNTDKTIDVHFGNSGFNSVNWASGSLHRSNSLLLQPSGRIIIAGRALFPFDFAIARFNSNGFLDQGFGSGGKVLTDMGTGGDEIYALAQQPDGKLVAVGQINDANGYDFAIARYDASDSNTLANRALFDYDGDGRSDVSVFRPSTNTWYIINSGDSSLNIRTFGINGDFPTPADFDGDSKTDIAITRNGNWWYSLSGGNGFAQQFPWNVSGVPRPGDFTGDGRADLVAYQPGGGVWSRRNSFNSSISNVTFGAAGDKAILGDFDGDARTDPAIYRPSTGEWWYDASSAGGQHRAARWGISTDIPVAADYDGDKKTDFAVYRPSEGVWYIYNSSNNSSTIMSFGLAEDKPVAADYDGDGKSDIAVFRPSTGIWYLMRSTAGFSAVQWGVAEDIPTPNAFVP